ncbi:piwi-like protein 1 [Chiloscyllium plagiosum]|uniref:piwi-like protein 1 n=1 Tax=Chiloscyllium plagiosum TaxID=36176 RepID=UPI001CB7B7FF|nr:piwi-like protein 1 [Chiloscyllium plagiosum]
MSVPLVTLHVITAYDHGIEVEDRSEAFLKALQSNVTQSTRIVVCVLPSNRKDKYDTIKKYLCVECPTPSQCVVARTLSKPQALMAIATKIALQINCKMGGELWSVEIPLKQLMVVGIDCYHDNAAGRKSIAGFVASINQSITRWFSRCILQERGQELVDGLKVCLQVFFQSLIVIKRFSKRLPIYFEEKNIKGYYMQGKQNHQQFYTV